MFKSLIEGAKLSPLALLLNPIFWICFCGWTAFVAFYCIDLSAERERLKQTEITAKALQRQVEVNDEVLKRERALRTADNAEFQTYREIQDHAKEATAKLLSDIRSDNLRLRIPVRSPICRAAPAGSGETPDRSGNEGRAELTSDAAELLTTIASRGDTAIRKHAAVVDAYERLRLACTAPTDSPTTETP